MALIKRITLFLAVNFLVVLVVSFLLNLFNVAPYLSRYGLNIPMLAVFCLVWGMVGSFISLLLSKQMAKWMMGVRILKKGESSTSDELIKMVEDLSRKARLPRTPEVGIFHMNVSNAFATGPSSSNALVAVSDQLLRQMDREKLKAILGHEISHIANGDMVTMTLLQGVVNAFVMFLARVLAYVFSGQSRDENSSSSYVAYYFTVILFETIFMILGSMVIAAYSRHREYHADRGGAYLTSKQAMIGALRTLELEREQALPKELKTAEALLINSKHRGGLLALFASHPSIEDRVHRLESLPF